MSCSSFDAAGLAIDSLRFGSPTARRNRVDLSQFDGSAYDPGRGIAVRTLWYFVNALIFMTPLIPINGLKIKILRMFGAEIGEGVVLKPGVNVKSPWNLEIGDHCWIGEGAHLDTIGKISIGNHVCVSQHAYICTGSHDWTDPAFGTMVQPVRIEDGAWIACKATVMGGVTVGSHAILAAGSCTSADLEADWIYRGNPAEKIKKRAIGEARFASDRLKLVEVEEPVAALSA